MATPTLALIPTGYKAGKLYSVLPESGVGDFTVVRATEATRVNEEGLIETMGANVPRLDYSGGGCPVLLTEPQRTNLYAYSEDFSDASWSKSLATVVITSDVAPDGTTNSVYNLTGTNANLFTGGTTGIQHTVSIYAKSNGQGKDNFKLRLGNSVSLPFTVTDEWVRYEFTGTPTTNVFGLTVDGSPNNEWDILIWGAQLESASYPTSYIKTEGSAVTRNADQVTGAGDAATFNDSEGVLMAEISALVNSSTYRLISLNDNGTSNEIFIGFRFDTGKLYYNIDSGGVGQSSFISEITALNTLNKVCLKYKQNNISFYINGFEIYSDTTPSTMPIGLSVLKMSRGNDTLNFYGNTKQIQYFNSTLTDSELETLTSWTSFIEMAQAQNYNII